MDRAGPGHDKETASGPDRRSTPDRAVVLLEPPVVGHTVQLVHEPAGTGTARSTLATDVERADSLLGKAIGLMGRSSVPEDYALVFEFGRTGTRSMHMLGVRTPIDVCWLVDGEVQRVETLSAWTGHARALADTVVELPPGAARDVDVGDRLRVVDD